MGDGTLIPCGGCGTPVPRLTLPPDRFDAVVRALCQGSRTLAAAEVRDGAACDAADAQAWLAHLLSCARAWPLHPDDRQVIEEIDTAFDDVQKPEHFTDFDHCDECRAHDDTLRSRTRETLQRGDLGNPAWDPLVFSSPEGIGYLFPSLARYALLPSAWTDHQWYGSQLIDHLAHDAGRNRFLAWCDEPQRRTVWRLLEHLRQTRAPLLAEWTCEADLQIAITHWRPTA